MTFAGEGYQGAGAITVWTPHKRHHPGPPLLRNQEAVNRSHAKVRALGERSIATLETWKVLARLHCLFQRSTGPTSARSTSARCRRAGPQAAATTDYHRGGRITCTQPVSIRTLSW